jgi:hypothetical protein
MVEEVFLGDWMDVQTRVFEPGLNGVLTHPHEEGLKLLIQGYLTGKNALHFEISATNLSESRRLILDEIGALRRSFQGLHPAAPEHFEIDTDMVWIANNRWATVTAFFGLSIAPWVSDSKGKPLIKFHRLSRRAFFSASMLGLAGTAHTSGVVSYRSRVESQLRTVYTELIRFEAEAIDALREPERRQSPEAFLEMKFDTRVDMPGQKSSLELKLYWQRGLPILRAVSSYF